MKGDHSKYLNRTFDIEINVLLIQCLIKVQILTENNDKRDNLNLFNNFILREAKIKFRSLRKVSCEKQKIAKQIHKLF